MACDVAVAVGLDRDGTRLRLGVPFAGTEGDMVAAGADLVESEEAIFAVADDVVAAVVECDRLAKLTLADPSVTEEGLKKLPIKRNKDD